MARFDGKSVLVTGGGSGIGRRRRFRHAAAREYIADGIRINAVSPGPTDTPMSLRPGETEADRAARLKTALPIGRVGALEEVASAVLWLASPDAGFAVGHDLVVDGGASA